MQIWEHELFVNLKVFLLWTIRHTKWVFQTQDFPILMVFPTLWIPLQQRIFLDSVLKQAKTPFSRKSWVQSITLILSIKIRLWGRKNKENGGTQTNFFSKIGKELKLVKQHLLAVVFQVWSKIFTLWCLIVEVLTQDSQTQKKSMIGILTKSKEKN